jgi:hypothetical protein
MTNEAQTKRLVTSVTVPHVVAKYSVLHLRLVWNRLASAFSSFLVLWRARVFKVLVLVTPSRKLQLRIHYTCGLTASFNIGGLFV